MGPNFKPYKTGMVTVFERCPCGRGAPGRSSVFYICRCDCGKEFVVTGDELSKHPYSCGCTPKPSKKGTHNNEWALGYDDGTMAVMLKKTRKVYSYSKSGVSGVRWDKKRKKWEAYITFKGTGHFLGYYDKKEDAIKARVEGERKYYEPYLKELEEKRKKKS